MNKNWFLFASRKISTGPTGSRFALQRLHSLRLNETQSAISVRTPGMIRLKLRIGAKLAVASGIGVILAAGMVVNEQLNNGAVEQLTRLVVTHEDVATAAVSADRA